MIIREEEEEEDEEGNNVDSGKSVAELSALEEILEFMLYRTRAKY